MVSKGRGDFCGGKLIGVFRIAKKTGKLLVDLYLRLAQNRAKQKHLDKRLLLRKKDSQACTPHIG
jgi:hypothetical protein